MPGLQALLLCDFAQVRSDLLFVLSGGIVRVIKAELPAPLNLFAAGSLLVEPDQVDQVHELRLKITCDGSVLGEAVLGVQAAANPSQPPGYAPTVMFAVGIGVSIGAYGVHDLVAYLNDAEAQRITFYVTESPAAAG